MAKEYGLTLANNKKTVKLTVVTSNSEFAKKP